MEQFHFYYQNQKNGIVIEQSVYRTGSYHYNWHTELELLVVLRGEIEVCSQLTSRILEEDDIIFINPNSGHATFSREPESVVMVLHADPRFLNTYFEETECLSFLVCSDEKTRGQDAFRAVRREIAAIAQNIQGDTPAQKLALDSAFYSLMREIVTHFPPQKVQSASFQADEKKTEAMETILKYIHKNYRKKIRLDSLAKASGYNASYLSQLFKSSLGINFYDYLTRIRLREATLQLSQTDKKILDIALENGFPDLKSFNTTFRKTFRKSPSEYRSQLSEDHMRIDLAFKKEYLPVDDALLGRKLKQYSETGERGKEVTHEADEKKDILLRGRAENLLKTARELASQAEQLQELLSTEEV